MRTPSPFFFAAISLCLFSGKAESQNTAFFNPGSRVRVTLAEGRSVEGVLLAASETLISVQDLTLGSELEIPTASIDLAQVHTGQKRNTLKGLGYGLLIGGGTGAALGLIGGGSPEDCWLVCFTAGEMAAMGAVAFGALGGITGLIAGTFIRSDRWEEVYLFRAKPSFQVSRGGGFDIGLSIPTRR